MIRVLQIVTDMNCGGLETMIMNYYRCIDRTIVQFDFLTHRPHGYYDEEIKNLGGNIYHISKLNPFSNSYKKELESFFKAHPEYRVIHVHQDCLSSVILKVAEKCGIPVRIAHSHSSNQDKNLKYFIKLYYKQYIKKYATNLLACSQEAGEWMFNTDDFSVVNNAIEAKDYIFDTEKRKEIQAEYGLSDKLVIGHVGRFTTAKNHHFLLHVFNEISQKTDAMLVLVGDDKNAIGAEIHQLVHTLGLDDKVIFTGLRNDVNNIMQAIDVFVMPSLFEGLPVTIIEAQASGLPCLISDHVPIECKKTDLVYQLSLEDSPEEWAEKVIELSKMPRYNTLNEIKKAGFDIEENAKLLQTFYLNCMNGEE